MKNVVLSTLAAAGLALSISTAFAASNSPQGNVVVDTFTPSTGAHFLSGNVSVNAGDSLSSNAIDARTREAVQQGRNWPEGNAVSTPARFLSGSTQFDARDFMSSNAIDARTREAVQQGRSF